MSNAPDCPDLATLLSAVDGDLSPDEYQDVAGHLQNCERCRNRLRAIDETVVVGRLVAASASSAEAERVTRFRDRLSKEQSSDERRRRIWRLAAVPAAMLAAAAIAGIAIVQAPASDSARADDLLVRAIASEQSASDRSRQAVRLSLTPFSRGILHGQDVGAVATVPAVSSGTLPQGDARGPDVQLAFAAAKLQEAGVDLHRPLSAAAFGAWRAREDERARRDRVTVTGDLLILRTALSSGSVRQGELRVDRVSYRVVGQAWTVDGIGRIEGRLLAGTEALQALASFDRRDGPARSAGEASADDMLERLELDTRLVVSAVNPDGTVKIGRQGSRVVVTGVLASAAKRQAIIDQLRAKSGVDVSLRSRAPRAEVASGDLQDWTARTFGDTRARRTFARSLREASESVDRRITGLDTLARRYPATAERTLSADANEKLRALIAREYAALISDLLLLDARLTPLGLGSRRLAPAPKSPSAATWRGQAAKALPVAAQLRVAVDDLLTHSDVPPDAETIARKFSDIWSLVVGERSAR